MTDTINTHTKVRVNRMDTISTLISCSSASNNSFREFNRRVNRYQSTQSIDTIDVCELEAIETSVQLLIHNIKAYKIARHHHDLNLLVSPHTHVTTLMRKNRGS